MDRAWPTIPEPGCVENDEVAGAAPTVQVTEKRPAAPVSPAEPPCPVAVVEQVEAVAPQFDAVPVTAEYVAEPKEELK